MMKGLRGGILLVMGVLVVGAGLWFEPGQRARGWVGGEAFFRGHPTRWWKESLNHPEPLRQAGALEAIRDGEEQAVPVLVEIVADPHAEIEPRWAAAELLGKLKEKGRAGVPVLLDWLDDASIYTRGVAVRVLGEMASDDDEVCDRLITRLQGSERKAVLQVLSEGSGGSEQVITELIELVRSSEDPAEVGLGVEALGRRAARAGAIGPLLIGKLALSEEVVRVRILEALGKLREPTPAVIDAVMAQLSSESGAIRASAVRSLGWFGPRAQRALPALRGMKGDRDATVRKRVAQAIQRIETTE